MLTEDVERALTVALGSPVRQTRRLSGGDINDAFEIRLESGVRYFLKTNETAPAPMFPAEARGLSWLRSAGALRVPEVRAVSNGQPGQACFLVLELLEPAPRRPGFDELLGRGLAELHGYAPTSFGADHDNFIGSLPQLNRQQVSWAEFYWQQRLEPQLRLAADSGRASSKLRRAFERLALRLPELLGPEEPPALLHGDLWSGNLHVDERGEPCLIDPAAYGGHREIDLAMMQLFGGFSERVFRSYQEVMPLSPGHAERVQLHQLYPLLVHLNLFGGSYAASVERALAQYV
jgi:protein-ribulosamine 3-kinase